LQNLSAAEPYPEQESGSTWPGQFSPQLSEKRLTVDNQNRLRGIAMTAPVPDRHPPFNITRASHTVITVTDLAACRDFYTEVIGLLVSDEDKDTVFLRGLEEIGHHSLVLKRTDGPPLCERVGARVFDEEDLEKAFHFFKSRDLPVEWVERPYQSRTLHLTDEIGMPLELCAKMETRSRNHVNVHLHKGAGAMRFDHFQFLVPDVHKASQFYGELGFRVSDYFTTGSPDDRILGAFMYRKTNPHDFVFMTRPGPAMHHFAFIVAESHCLFRACDTAGSLGLSSSVDRGPSRHGQGHQLYAYFRDPSGHRVEVLPPPIQLVDIDEQPVCWEPAARFTWDLPPSRRWIFEGTPFAGVETTDPVVKQEFFSLEDYLAKQAPPN
jgi:catechol 2,3-dioxygenase